LIHDPCMLTVKVALRIGRFGAYRQSVKHGMHRYDEKNPNVWIFSVIQT
jgi:hypothetical protein